MAKVISRPKFKPVECIVCGCRYEHEDGDYIAVATTYAKSNSIYENCSKVIYMTVACPVCGNMNVLDVDKD